MTAFSGMDVDVVRSVAGQLDARSTDLATITATIDGLVQHLLQIWDGQDAQTFSGWWYEQHRPALSSVQEAVHGLSVTATRNVSEQTVASGGAGSAGGGNGARPGIPELPGSSAPLGAAALAAGGLGSLLRGGDGRSVMSAIRQGRALWNDGVHRDAAQQASAHAGVGGQASGRWGFVPASAGWSADADASARMSEHVSVTRNAVDASINAGASAGVSAGVHGQVGNQYVGADGGARVDAGASARAAAAGHLGRDGASANADFGANATVSASANADVHAAGVHGTAGATAEAGLDLHAHVGASVTASEVKADVNVGAALGIGGGVKFSVDVKPREVLQSVQHIHLW